jgi:hypothetical protein
MIILQFDNVYHHWGLLMLQSLQLHERHTPVLCDTVNLTGRQVAELEQAHGRVVVMNDTSTFSETSPEKMAFRKPFVMQNAMQGYPNQPWYGLFDADFLVRKPLGSLWALMDTHPTALVVTDGMWNGKFYRQLETVSSIVMVRRDGKKLIDCWAKWYYHDKPLGSIEPLYWLWDQITLAEAWTEARVPYAVIPINFYADDQLRPASAIWSANVPQKEEYYERFRREYQRQKANLSS